MPLTDTEVRAAKSGESLRKLSDGGGLQLWVMPTGSKLWRLAFRYGGKQKLLSIGSYPSITLAGARSARDAAKVRLAAGEDPSAVKRVAKAAKQAEAATFGVVKAEYVAKLKAEGRAAGTVEKVQWLLSLASKLDQRPIAELKAGEILDVLRGVEARGRRETAKRLRSRIGAVARYAVATGRAEVDPTSALKGALLAPVVKPRAALTDPAQFGGLLRAIDAYPGQPTTRIALQMMALLFPRPGELRAAEWSEFDLENAVWTIPAHRAKMRRAHKVPLPAQALSLLRELRRFTGDRLLFQGVGHTRQAEMRPLSENTLNMALRRLGYSTDEATSHGFRATASTLLNESNKWSPNAIERALAHQDEGAVRRAYARGEHWAERVRMSNWWGDYLDTLRADNGRQAHGEHQAVATA